MNHLLTHRMADGTVLADSGSMPLGGHLLHAVLIGGAVVIFLILVGRMYYATYKKTGKWQSPDKLNQ